MNHELYLQGLTLEEKEKLKVLLDKLIDASQIHDRHRKVWMPKIGETYWTISADSPTMNCIRCCIYTGDTIDCMRYQAGLIFQTEEEAKFALEKMRVKQELNKYAYEYNDPEKEAWVPENYHYMLTYSYLTQDLTITKYGMEREESVTYFTSEEVAQCAIEHIGKDRIIRYLFDIRLENATNE